MITDGVEDVVNAVIKAFMETDEAKKVLNSVINSKLNFCPIGDV